MFVNTYIILFAVCKVLFNFDNGNSFFKFFIPKRTIIGEKSTCDLQLLSVESKVF